MTAKHLVAVSDLLEQLHGHAYFRPEAGPLRERLTEVVLDALAGEVALELSECPFGLEVSIGSQEDDGELMIGFTVDYPGVAHSSEIALAACADDVLEDLAGYLTRLVESVAPDVTTEAGKALLRKKHEADSHEKNAASARLKVSPQWLKSVIPCTDYSYDEVDGKKIIREYYWSKELIERLFRIKCTKTTPDDLQYVATECCEGDLEWARDLIARLKSPNRAEPVPREQPQKLQGKPAVRAVPGERVRTRSRHRKPSREAGKDPVRPPEPATGQKTPSN